MTRTKTLFLTSSLLAISTAAARADTLYSNFAATTPPYDTASADAILKPGATGSGGTNTSLGADFTLTADATLTSVTLAFANVAGDGFDFSLRADDSIMPGATLYSWSNVTVGGAFPAPNEVTLTASPGVALQAGLTYWLVAVGHNDTSFGSWYENTTGDKTLATSLDGGLTWQGPTKADAVAPAFKIDGTLAGAPVAAPTPAALPAGLLLLSAFACSTRLRRQPTRA